MTSAKFNQFVKGSTAKVPVFRSKVTRDDISKGDEVVYMTDVDAFFGVRFDGESVTILSGHGTELGPKHVEFLTWKVVNLEEWISL